VYLSSYSHTGRYYTIRDIPVFDADGLWRHQGIGFSRHGSLKSTAEHMVLEAEAGRTHNELHVRLQDWIVVLTDLNATCTDTLPIDVGNSNFECRN